MKNPYITLVETSILNGHFNLDVPLKNGLNILSGENGTGKTKFLKYIKQQIGKDKIVFHEDRVTNKVVAISPKRNANKQNADEIINSIRQQGIDLSQYNNQLVQKRLQDQSFTNYTSFGEHFIVLVEDLVKEGNHTYPQAVDHIKNDFETIMQMIFKGYQIHAIWENKRPTISLTKGKTLKVNIDQLSCGENEILSLVFNIYSSRDNTDIYLIDEPEIHLNWSLEENLFDFFEWFCNTYNKQIIVTSHSRVIFKKQYLAKSLFFKWNEDKVEFSDHLDEDIKSSIAGEAINIIEGISLSDKICFVEDKTHESVIKELGNYKKIKVDIRIENGRTNVEKLSQILKKEKIDNAIFIVDGDNRPADKELLTNHAFIQLDKYCLENYFLDKEVLENLTGKPDIGTLIEASIKECLDPSFVVVKKLIDNGIALDENILDTLDGSKIIKKLAPKIGYSKVYDLIPPFIEKAKELNKLEVLFKTVLDKI